MLLLFVVVLCQLLFVVVLCLKVAILAPDFRFRVAAIVLYISAADFGQVRYLIGQMIKQKTKNGFCYLHYTQPMSKKRCFCPKI